MQNTSTTYRCDAPGDTFAIKCVGCPALLTTEEVYCCSACVDSWVESDPNGLMGVDDEESEAEM